MTAVVVGKERLVAAHGMGVGDAAQIVVSTAEKRGYSVAATGPGQFRMIRQTRPVWATVAAIVGFPFLGLGLLFLLIKKTDEGTVAVFEERDGTKVRLVGSIDDEIAAAITDGRIVVSPPAGPKPATSSSAPQAQPMIDSTPWAKPSAGLAAVDDDDAYGETVARPRRKVNGGALGLRFPDGRVVPLGSGIIIGRSPSPPQGQAAVIPVAYPDNEMSKTHVLVELAGSGVVVTDLHSTNGTAVSTNGNLVRCQPGVRVPMDATATIHAGSTQINVTEVS